MAPHLMVVRWTAAPFGFAKVLGSEFNEAPQGVVQLLEGCLSASKGDGLENGDLPNVHGHKNLDLG
jgi:hypothetical protein